MKEKKNRICPSCGHIFKPMTDNQWKNVLYIHLTTSQKHHFMSDKEAAKYLDVLS